MRRFLMAACAAAALSAPAGANDASVDALLAKMTIEEKISLIHGGTEPSRTYQGQAGWWPGLPSLGIPPLRLMDGPPGVLTRRPSTGFPATMALAATFSADDAEAEGKAVARSAKALGQQIVLEPYINILRDQAFERAYNTYGEDPVLTGAVGAAFIKGVQGQGVMAQAKHFIAYEGGSDVVVGGQALREIYAAPFADAIEAGVSSLMCSYNKLNGPYSCGNAATLTDLLRKELGFQGFVTSDWGATHASEFVRVGLDMEMPGGGMLPSHFAADIPPPFDPSTLMGLFSGITPPEEPVLAAMAFPAMDPPSAMKDKLKDGSVNEAEITRAARNILRQIDRFGWLKTAPDLAQTPEPVAENAAIGRKVAADAAVLLKNDGVLPLGNSAADSVVLIGPGAGQVVAVGLSGEKALGHIERQVSPLAALQASMKNIRYAVANDMDGTLVPASVLSGLLRKSAGEPDAADKQVNHTLKAKAALKAGKSYVWTGDLVVPAAGRYQLHLQVIGAAGKMTLDGQSFLKGGSLALHGDVLQPGQDNVLPTTDGLDNLRAAIDLTPGRHPIQITADADTSGAPVQVRLAWVTPEDQHQNYQRAVDAARHAKTAVVFVWGRNRPVFGLPGDQDRLIEDVAAANPNIVVVLNTSEPVAMPWADKVKAIVQMWYPGDEGGWATADVLTGKVNPAGRLPFTWPLRLEDSVANTPDHPERSLAGIDGKTTYSEGIMVGYRWFDSQHIAPRYPFGFGLSYTRFGYRDLKAVRAADGSYDVSFSVTNIGRREGDDVPQLYLAAPPTLPADGQVAPEALVGFSRVHLGAGETKQVEIRIPAKRFQYWSEAKASWQPVAGKRALNVGGSSRSADLGVEIGS